MARARGEALGVRDSTLSTRERRLVARAGTGPWAERQQAPRTLTQSSGATETQEEATPLGTLSSPCWTSEGGTRSPPPVAAPSSPKPTLCPAGGWAGGEGLDS